MEKKISSFPNVFAIAAWTRNFINYIVSGRDDDFRIIISLFSSTVLVKIIFCILITVKALYTAL